MSEQGLRKVEVDELVALGGEGGDGEGFDPCVLVCLAAFKNAITKDLALVRRFCLRFRS